MSLVLKLTLSMSFLNCRRCVEDRYGTHTLSPNPQSDYANKQTNKREIKFKLASLLIN